MIFLHFYCLKGIRYRNMLILYYKKHTITEEDLGTNLFPVDQPEMAPEIATCTQQRSSSRAIPSPK